MSGGSTILPGMFLSAELFRATGAFRRCRIVPIRVTGRASVVSCLAGFAFLIVPLVGAFFIDLLNALTIKLAFVGVALAALYPWELGEKADPFAPAGARGQPGDVDELHLGGDPARS